MKQPDLGKRIAELRKAKGLTQDELVQKCNLNVRTLQRIESGEVTPRSYTMRLIFAALDYDIHATPKNISNRLINSTQAILFWFEKAYQNIRELFNFNTHPVKKILILSFCALIISASLFYSVNSRIKAHDKMVIRQKLMDTCSNSKFMQWFNSGQIDSISIRYMDHACMMADNSQTTYDRDGIQKHFRQLYDRGLRFSRVQSNFLVVADSIAVDRGEWSVSLESVVVATGTYMTQWHYVDGKWLGENEMSKSDVLPDHQAR
jgi:transcriptional regulator with XRE-family HTH domain